MIRAMMGRKKQQGIAIADAPNGVYILRTDNRLYTQEEWDAAWNAEAVGVACLSDNCRFAIHPTEESLSALWPSYNLEGVEKFPYEELANDFNGVANTDAVIARLGAEAYGPNYCRSVTFRDGKSGYLGAGGEWMLVIDNLTEVNETLSLIGGLELCADPEDPGYGYSYWTSTIYDGPSYYGVHAILPHGAVGPALKSYGGLTESNIRPFRSL